MKKSIVSLLVLCVSLCAFAQTKQHMKFMGIPMGTSISSFQQKLEAKGIKYDRVVSKQIPAGSKVFKGPFAGYDASIYTYHDTKDKKVYRAKAMIDREDLSRAEEIYYDLLLMLSQKYPDATVYDVTDDYKGCCIYTDLGRIDCYITRFDGDWTTSYRDRYSVSIDYWDSKTLDSHDSNRLDDL